MYEGRWELTTQRASDADDVALGAPRHNLMLLLRRRGVVLRRRKVWYRQQRALSQHLAYVTRLVGTF